jgi:hypothetical protein
VKWLARIQSWLRGADRNDSQPLANDAAPGEVYQQLLERFAEHIPTSPEAAFLTEVERLPPDVRRLYATDWVELTVRNGGLTQYFSLEGGALAPEAVEGFQTLGMPQTAAFLSEVMGDFGLPYPRSADQRQLVLDDEGPSGWYANEATLEARDDKMMALLLEENGGFYEAANRYALENYPDLA